MSMSEDPILTWLDKRERDNEGYPCDIDDLVGALRAVLGLLGEPVSRAHYEDPRSVREDEIRQVIATALGVTGSKSEPWARVRPAAGGRRLAMGARNAKEGAPPP